MKYEIAEVGDLTVKYPVDCGNAPKKLVLKDFHVAIAAQNIDFVSENLHDESTWHIVGKLEIRGKEEIIPTISKIYQDVASLEIDQIITHGKITSINGTISFHNKEKLAFCHIHTFNNASKTAKIKETTSYLIHL